MFKRRERIEPIIVTEEIGKVWDEEVKRKRWLDGIRRRLARVIKRVS